MSVEALQRDLVSAKTDLTLLQERNLNTEGEISRIYNDIKGSTGKKELCSDIKSLVMSLQKARRTLEAEQWDGGIAGGSDAASAEEFINKRRQSLEALLNENAELKAKHDQAMQEKDRREQEINDAVEAYEREQRAAQEHVYMEMEEKIQQQESKNEALLIKLQEFEQTIANNQPMHEKFIEHVSQLFSTTS